jgi:hypothetical protein
MDKELYTSVGAQTFHKVVAIVRENNSMYWVCVAEIAPKILMPTGFVMTLTTV